MEEKAIALSDTKLKNLKPQDNAYKVADRDGMYVVVSPKRTITFRYDYRLAGQRETLTLGQYDEFQASPSVTQWSSSTESAVAGRCARTAGAGQEYCQPRPIAGTGQS